MNKTFNEKINELKKKSKRGLFLYRVRYVDNAGIEHVKVFDRVEDAQPFINRTRALFENCMYSIESKGTPKNVIEKEDCND